MTAADDTGLVLRAAQFAAMKHRNQRRKDKEATPYINHPLALANVLWHEGRIADARIIAAALLHDTVEDTRTTRAELARAFGKPIAAVVAEVTDNKRLSQTMLFASSGVGMFILLFFSFPLLTTPVF